MQRANSTSSALKLFGVLILALTLAACGSSDSDSSRRNNIIDGAMPGPDPGPGTGGSEAPGDPDEPDAELPEPVPAELGVVSDDDFQVGVIATALGEGDLLAPGGIVRLSVHLMHEDELVLDGVQVNFISDCLENGRASLWSSANNSEDDTPIEDHNVTTSWGTATVWYEAGTCTGEDTITARAIYSDLLAVPARTTISIAPDTLDHLIFVDATPDQISIANMGSTSTSKVRFQAIGAKSNGPMADAEVMFALQTKMGDAQLDSTSAISDENGYVTATVRAGNAAGVMFVSATNADNVSAFSSQLVVATGIPVQGRSSLSIETPHLPAWGVDGVETQVTMSLADQHGNDVPEGTSAYFTSSAGRIDASCTVDENSQCNVIWNSQGDRPEGSGGFIVHPGGNVTCPTAAECRPGRVVVVGTANGNESFTDVNGNGLYDPGIDIFVAAGACSANEPRSYIPPMNQAEACDDLGEAYLDTNFNGIREPEERIIANLNNSNDLDGPNGMYNGILCPRKEADADNCSRDTVTIRSQGTIVMASNHVHRPIPGLPSSLTLGPGASTTLRVVIADQNGNGMPPGTSVAINDNLARNVAIELSTDTLNSTEDFGPNVISIFVEATDTDAAEGEFQLIVSSEGVENFATVTFN